jgi:hypothetical protein
MRTLNLDNRDPQSLSPRFRVWIQIWNFANARRSYTGSVSFHKMGIRLLYISNLLHTKIMAITYRGRVPDTGIIPDCCCVLGPLHTRNTVMVPRDEPHHVVPNHLVLIVVHSINLCHMQANACEYGFPASDSVCTHNRVRRREVVSNI